MSDITATSFTVGNATSNRQGDTYVAHIFGGKPANTLAEGETYPVVYGTYNGTSGAGLFIPTGGTKPQFHYCKMLVATNNAAAAGYYWTKSNIDSQATYPYNCGWTDNAKAGFQNKINWNETDIDLFYNYTEWNAPQGFYFYYLIGR